MLQQILPETIFAFFAVFLRVGAMMMIVPGFGERFIPARVRLAIALAVSFVMLAPLRPLLPPLPEAPLTLLWVVLSESLVGLMIGLVARMMLSGLHVAGTVISFQSSLGIAQGFDPTQGQQNAIVGSFMTLVGVMVIMTADLHYLFLEAVRDSYTLFPPGRLPEMADFARLATDTVVASFKLGIQIAAPFLVYSLILYIGMGLVNRLMPQMQVFFIIMPLQIAVAFFLLAVVFSAAMLWFQDHVTRTIGFFIIGA